jgi:SAM-dependent methyltransferase
MPDRTQLKPGTFEVDRCLDCGHLFQNPRLSASGLRFYYRDFYDGLGGTGLDAVFGLSLPAYLERARAYQGTPPRRWLDVGGGYGHFCLIARSLWPHTTFECLDMGTSVDEAVRRGWAAKGHRGLLPELAPRLAGQFDVVSLSHCLEHTPDPRAEIAAARTVLAPGGSLIIEVPDPDSVFRTLFRGFWLPYLQPQHLHLLSVSNLCRLLKEAGLEVTRVQRGEVHVPVDFFSPVFMALTRLAPEDMPWRPSQGAWRRRWHDLLWGLGGPLLLAAMLLDGLVQKLAFLPHLSNAFRVVAKNA